MVQGAVGGRDALWRWWRRERSTSSAGVGSRAEVLPPLGGDETSWAPPRPGDPAIGKLPACAQPRATLECGSASSCERVNPRMKVVQPCATGRLSDLADSAHHRCGAAARFGPRALRLWAARRSESRSRITVDPFPDHASNRTSLVPQPSAAHVLKNIGRCACELLEIKRHAELCRMRSTRFRHAKDGCRYALQQSRTQARTRVV